MNRFLQSGLLQNGSYLAGNLQSDSDVNSPSYDTDFSDKFEKSKNKVIYFSALSALVGVFTLENSPEMFGYTLGGLTDSRLEWILWVTASVLLLNMMFRFVDERRRFERYKSEVFKFRAEFNSIINNIDEMAKDLIDLLTDKRGVINKATGVMNAKLKVLRSEVLDENYSKETQGAVLNEIEYLRTKMLDAVKRIEARSQSVSMTAKTFPHLLEKFQKDNRPVQKFVGFGKIRLLTFDVFLPVSLYVTATLIHFTSEASSFLLALTH